MMNRLSLFAFLIPFIVQTAAQAMSRFKNWDMDTLLLLPGQREDPAFIMDLEGNIVLAIGKTEQLFKKNSIRNIIDLIKADGFDRLINNLDRRCPDPETRSIDIYSEALQNWYEIKFKPVVSHCGRLPEKLLVWFTAWFVNTKPKKHESGAGQPPFMFKTDSTGNGTYSAALNESPYGKWEMLMIVLHPNGDPKDMKNMVGALSANLK